MTIIVGLLRGVNVGGHNRVPMADLRAAAAGLGFEQVRTYLNSGNVVFEADVEPSPEMAASLRQAVAERTSVSVPFVLRTAAALRTALEQYPFADEPVDDKLKMIGLMSTAPSSESLAALEPHRFLPERFEVITDNVHLLYPNGQARTKMTIDYFERRLGVTVTTRNLATVRALAEEPESDRRQR